MKKKFKYDMTVIMPAYNNEEYVALALDSILKQDYDLNKIQVISIDDSSTDGTLNELKKYQDKIPNLKIIHHQKNKGLVETRNEGISLAEGKYILYLDGDDTISEDTMSSLIDFFDKHYDEVDLVTYKIIPMLKDKPQKLHYRYKYLIDTKVYDLLDFFYRYASVTTMNYCVKNKGKDNILFEKQEGHEDQKYSMTIIKEKMKIGYVSTGTYFYTQHPNSITKTKFHAYYLFDPTIKLWEDTFNQFKNEVPGYYQSLFINDIAWKTRANILKPYQYEGKKFDKEFSRVIKLLNTVDDSTILNHPGVEKNLKYHLINQKTNNDFKVYTGEFTENAVVMNHGVPIYVCNNVELTFLKLTIKDDKIKMLARVGSPLFLFVDKPDVYLVKNQNYSCKEKMDIRESSYNYFNTKEPIAKFWLFETEIDTLELERIEFKVEIQKAILNVQFKFAEKLLFNDRLERYEYYNNGIQYVIVDGKNNNSFLKIDHTRSQKVKEQEVKYTKSLNSFYFSTDKKRWLVRFLATRKIKKFENIWLYYDCKGVKKDNAYYQFIHDLDKKDGIRRYYVSNNDSKINKEIFTRKQLRYVIKFNSYIHKIMYLKAKKIITAYIEENNCLPYTSSSFSNYADIIPMDREVVYLQHGVLHAHMPWKYSLDRILADREVISTHFEKENLINNYAFTSDHLIDAGMPRYDYITQKEKPKNKILFAPSWRNYLIGRMNNEFVATDDQFLFSKFYKETKAFLEDPKLHKILEENDFVLDFKLHPIFKRYSHFYELKSDRITFGSALDKDSEYKIFITDYSSFVFDFVYLRRAILYFFPDYDLFKAGMNIYREIDIPFEEGFGKFFEEHDKLIDEIETLIKNDCIPEKKYHDKTNGFFIHNDNEQCDRIYEALIKK